MFAQLLGLKVGDFVWTGGDCHIYQNHFEQVKQQIIRTPVAGPTLEMPKFKDLDELVKTSPLDYKLHNYTPMDSIKAPMAV
jgi:thymidylate synthase